MGYSNYINFYYPYIFSSSFNKFFKSTLTVPKIKDLVNTSSKKYENIYNIIQSDLKNNSNNFQTKQNSSEISSLNNDYTLIDLLPKSVDEGSSMKNELKNFLKKQLNSSSNTNTIVNENSLSMGSYTNY